jgi:hypothetical protein
MSCREVQGGLTAYLDGELDAATASALRGHLRLCAACRAAAEDHAAIRDSLAELERPDPSPAVWDGVLERLGEAEIADAQRPRWARLLDRVRPHLVPAGLAAAACAVAVLIIQVRDRGEPGATGAEVVAAHDGAATSPAPGSPGDQTEPPPAPRPTIDASAELAAETARLEARMRDTVAELLPLARVEQRGGARRQFDRAVAALEAAVVRAPAGKARERAWHDLLGYLERAALGETADRVAVGP